MNTSILLCLVLAMGAFSAPLGDPEITMDPEELIQYWGYPAEKHLVTTTDGYILPVYRIPHGKDKPAAESRPVVFLQHGLENSAADWLVNRPHQSAAYIFADAGFDVWIGNFRGNTYAKRHVKLTPNQHEFWKFSWSEMAKYDLPAMINKALEISKSDKIYYIAHSMGTMTGFAQFSQDPELAKRIKQFYAIGPVMNMKHTQGPAKYAAPFTKYIALITRLFGMDQFLPSNKLQELWARFVCKNNPFTNIMCKNMLLMISGPNTKQIEEQRIPVINAHSPAGTSVQNVIHFGQLMNSGKFQAYDYGSTKENQARYGSKEPPVYDVSNLEVPVAFYSSESDWLSTPLDVETAVKSIKNVIANVKVPAFNHMDFVWGVRAATQVYQPIRDSITKDFTPPPNDPPPADPAH